jgi:hypothetical protein
LAKARQGKRQNKKRCNNCELFEDFGFVRDSFSFTLCMCIYAQMKAADDGDGAFRYPVVGEHDKRGGKIPLENCVFILGPETITQQSA